MWSVPFSVFNLKSKHTYIFTINKSICNVRCISSCEKLKYSYFFILNRISNLHTLLRHTNQNWIGKYFVIFTLYEMLRNSISQFLSITQAMKRRQIKAVILWNRCEIVIAYHDLPKYNLSWNSLDRNTTKFNRK